MRLSEILRLEGNALREAIESENQTGVSTDDLIKIVHAHRKDEWKTFESAESLNEYLDHLTAQARSADVNEDKS